MNSFTKIKRFDQLYWNAFQLLSAGAPSGCVQLAAEGEGSAEDPAVPLFADEEAAAGEILLPRKFY